MPSVALATICALAAAFVLVALGDGGVPSHSTGAAVDSPRPAPAPAFEPNRGQADPRVEFLARGRGYSLFLTKTEAVLSLQAGEPGTTTLLGEGTLTSGTGLEADGAVVRMGLADANPDPAVAGRSRQPGRTSYIGTDRTRTGIPNFGRVQYSSVYPGIDMAWHGSAGALEYDFELAPGADPGRIGLTFEGAESVAVGDGGDLVMQTAVGELRHQAPYAYQETGGVRQPVESRYRIAADGTVGFELGAYDRTRPLVIDPQLIYSTYLGGQGSDQGETIAVDGAGNAYLTGSTSSSDFPTTAGAYSETDPNPSNLDAFVTKVAPDGQSLVYSTYLGGNGQDSGTGLDVDGDGHAYVSGRAATTWPTTPGAFQETDPSSTPDQFVVKLSTDGSSLEYSTYLGGGGIFEDGSDLAVDGDGSAYLTGGTDGDDWPTTPGAFQENDPDPGGPAMGFDGYVTKLNPAGSDLEYSTYLGGPGGGEAGLGIALDGDTAYVVGSSSSDAFPTTPDAFQPATASPGPSESDAFVVRVAADGSELDYSTYLGGTRADSGHGIDVHDGSAIVSGFTESSDFPTTGGSFQSSDPEPGGNRWEGWVTRVGDDGGSLDWSTYVGGIGPHLEGFLDLAVSDGGEPTATGYSGSQAYPTTPGAFQETDPDPVQESDGIVTTLSEDGSELAYSTYLGGNRFDHGRSVAVDGAGDLYVGGLTSSTNFPTTDGAFQSTDPDPVDYEAFVTKLHGEVDDPDPDPVPTTLVLEPDTAVNTVGTQHCVSATVTDQDGEPFAGVTVRFTVSGSSSSSGAEATGADGRAQHCYGGPAFPGSDVIEAYADSDGDGTRDEGEPGDSATKQWVLPVGAACKVSGGGDIVAASGDRATFGIGGGTYTDHGPATPLKVKSTQVLAVVCSGNRATIYGLAKVDGQGSHLYRIEVTDAGEPGAADRYSILLDTGYDSGDQQLVGGNVQIK